MDRWTDRQMNLLSWTTSGLQPGGWLGRGIDGLRLEWQTGSEAEGREGWMKGWLPVISGVTYLLSAWIFIHCFQNQFAIKICWMNQLKSKYTCTCVSHSNNKIMLIEVLKSTC